MVASDGFNTAEALADGQYRLPDSAPQAAIFGPADGSRFPAGMSVPLIAGGSDLETPPGDLEYSWSSDLAGPLGDEPGLLVRTLRPGTHRITLTVADAVGAEATAEVTIVIGTGSTALPDEDTREAVAALIGDEGGGTSSLADGLAVGGVLVLLVVVMAVGYALRRQRPNPRRD